ncbi:hypothetical protein [Actinoplanes sp. NPDC051851]|uniref:hypothetical protein n=1 Tax=Actinoplanes sp. NPDC051851 TaxID=3154753 RepID=UPI00343B7323
MTGLIDHLSWGAVLAVLPVAVVAIGVVLVALVTVAARRPDTQQHGLKVMAELARCLRILRGQR